MTFDHGRLALLLVLVFIVTGALYVALSVLAGSHRAASIAPVVCSTVGGVLAARASRRN